MKLLCLDKPCIISKYSKNKKGYARIAKKGFYLHHRYVYFKTYGDFDRKLLVCHKCDNPGCIEPSHLFLGTNQDNMTDMKQKGRQKTLKGEDHPRTTLTNDDVDCIRFLYKIGEATQMELAYMFRVERQIIHRIVHNKSWKNNEAFMS